MSAPRTVAVGLLGYGTVGSSVDRLLTERGDEIAAATGVRLEVAHALVRDPTKERAYPPRPGLLTTSFDDVASDERVEVVVEAIGGIEPARTYIVESLARGRPVVTANKQLLARRGADLARAAADAGVPLRYEASVCGAMPIVRLLEQGVAPRGIASLVGVVNGTTNYILTRMEAGEAYGDALAAAQEHGFAEPDPTDDVSGADAAAKMAILSRVAFGRDVTFDDVEWEGIDGLDAREVVAAHDNGQALRLVGRAERRNGSVEVSVRRTLLARDHPLAQLDSATNCVVVEGSDFGRLVLAGAGAGPPTASAVVSDLVDVVTR